MNKKISGILMIILFLGVCLSLPVAAKKIQQEIEVRFANIKMIVNDRLIQTAVEPFIYEGNVYAPVATIANMLQIEQEWDNDTPAVRFYNDDYVPEQAQEIDGEDASTTKILNRYFISFLDEQIEFTEIKENEIIESKVVSRFEGFKSNGNRRLLVDQFVSFTGESFKEILMMHRLQPEDKELGLGSPYILELFRYEDGDFISLDHVEVIRYDSKSGEYRASFYYEQDEVIVSIFDGEERIRMETYKWIDGAIQKASTFEPASE